MSRKTGETWGTQYIRYPMRPMRFLKCGLRYQQRVGTVPRSRRADSHQQDIYIVIRTRSGSRKAYQYFHSGAPGQAFRCNVYEF